MSFMNAVSLNLKNNSKQQNCFIWIKFADIAEPKQKTKNPTIQQSIKRC